MIPTPTTRTRAVPPPAVALAAAIALVAICPSVPAGDTAAEAGDPARDGGPAVAVAAEAPESPESPEIFEPAPAGGPVETMKFALRRGGTYDAEYRRSPVSSGPALMLITRKNAPPSTMNSVAEPLRAAGYSVLTIACPSQIRRVRMPNGRNLIEPKLAPADELREMYGSAKRALDFLSNEPSADTGRIGLVGAGMGANVAAMIGGSHPDRVPVMAFVAPNSLCHRVTMHHKLARSRDIPTLLLASTSRNLFTKTFVEYQGPAWKLIEGTSVPSGGFLAGSDSMSQYAEDVISWVKEHYPATGS